MIAFAASAAVWFAQAAAAPAATPAPVPAPTVAQVLDKEKGERALAAYRKFWLQLCAQFRSNQKRGEGGSPRLKAIGLEDLAPDVFCIEGRVGKALASGALLESGKDEVLVEVSTFHSAQTGQSLAVMRDDGKGYRLVRHVLDAARFEVRLRLVAPGRRDILVMCDYSGLGGVYPGGCGFFGRGRFKEPVKRARLPTYADPSPEFVVPDCDLDPRDDIGLLDLHEPCGPFSSVNAGKVAAQGDRLVVELVLENGAAVQGRGDVEGACSKRKTKTRRSFDIEYKFDGRIFRRVTPIPDAIKALLIEG